MDFEHFINQNFKFENRAFLSAWRYKMLEDFSPLSAAGHVDIFRIKPQVIAKLISNPTELIRGIEAMGSSSPGSLIWSSLSDQIPGEDETSFQQFAWSIPLTVVRAEPHTLFLEPEGFSMEFHLENCSAETLETYSKVWSQNFQRLSWETLSPTLLTRRGDGDWISIAAENYLYASMLDGQDSSLSFFSGEDTFISSMVQFLDNFDDGQERQHVHAEFLDWGECQICFDLGDEYAADSNCWDISGNLTKESQEFLTQLLAPHIKAVTKAG